MTCTKAVKLFTIEFNDKELSEIENALREYSRAVRDSASTQHPNDSTKSSARADRIESLSVSLNHIRLQSGM